MRQFIVIIPLLLLMGCYEGWQYPRGKGGEDPSQNPIEKPADKPYAYILYEVFTLSASAMQNSTCFPKSGIRDFRKAEWDLRQSSMETTLKGLADKVVPVVHALSSADCQTLSAIEAASVNAEPWPQGDEPQQDGKDRPFIHLKAVLWEEDPALQPSVSVTRKDWAAWSNLAEEGFVIRSGVDFLYSDPNNGFFTLWKDALEAENSALVLQSTVIDPVDPSEAGIQSRNQTVAKDTAAVAKWLQGLP